MANFAVHFVAHSVNDAYYQRLPAKWQPLTHFLAPVSSAGHKKDFFRFNIIFSRLARYS